MAGGLSLIPVGAGGGLAHAAAAAGQGGGASWALQGLALQDDLSSMLDALAAVFRVRPGLWHAREAPEAYPYVSGFMSHVSVPWWEGRAQQQGS